VSAAGGESFRSRSLSERVAGALPSSGGFLTVRRWLKPVFARWLSPAGGGLRSVLPNGEEVFVSPAFRHMTWNRVEYDAFRAAVKPGDIVLEAGANVGAYTILFAKWAGPSGRVFAFEPDPAAYEGLQSHIRLNGVAHLVTIEGSAIADGTKSRLRFELGQSSGVSRIVRGTQHTYGLRDVEATSIDRYCAAHGIVPRAIKIDVEGAELQALQGARRTIAAAGAGLQLFVEMHPHLWPTLGITANDVRSECAAQGLIVEALDHVADDVWQIEGVCLRLRPDRR
jgi:FkbM family methyltransferase